MGGGGATPRGDVAKSEKEGLKPRTSPGPSSSSAWIIFMALWMKNKRFVIYPLAKTSW